MSSNIPSVFIFGAGATRGAYEAQKLPPPLDIDFFNLANKIEGKGTRRLAKEVLETVWELNGRIEGIGLEEYYRDIENRAKIVSFAKPANQPKNWSKRQEQITELIRRVYIHTTSERKKGEIRIKESDIHKSIIKNVQNGDAVITFNYDTVIEESIESANMWNPIDGYGIRAFPENSGWCRKWLDRNNANSSSVRSKIVILKLHGSINWHEYQNQKIRLKQRPYYTKAKQGVPIYETIEVLAPGMNKPIDKNPYRRLWKEARHKLEKCESIVVLGYSLPEADLLARALFQEVIRQRIAKKEYIKELHLADPSKEVKNKYVGLLTPIMRSSGKVFMYNDIKEYAEKNKKRLIAA